MARAKSPRKPVGAPSGKAIEQAVVRLGDSAVHDPPLEITDRKVAGIAVGENESIVRALLDSASQSIIAVDAGGLIVLVNNATVAMFGYRREELIGQPVQVLVPVPGRQKHKQHQTSYFRDLTTRPMGLGLDLEARRKDGSTFPAEISLSGVETPQGKLAVAFVSDITERKRLATIARTHAEEVRALAARILNTQEEERRRVSRELHDQICQQLASLALEIDALIARVALSGNAQEWLQTFRGRVVAASEHARHLAYELHPSMLDDLGVVASLRALAKEFSARTGIRVKFSSSGGSWTIPREKASCLYRVAQESLQNIAHHSRAKHVALKLSRINKLVRLTLQDDGAGFDVEAARGTGGLGLVGMEERVRLVNGNLSIQSRAGGGTLIVVEIPLAAKNEPTADSAR